MLGRPQSGRYPSWFIFSDTHEAKDFSRNAREITNAHKVQLRNTDHGQYPSVQLNRSYRPDSLVD